MRWHADERDQNKDPCAREDVADISKPSQVEVVRRQSLFPVATEQNALRDRISDVQEEHGGCDDGVESRSRSQVEEAVNAGE